MTCLARSWRTPEKFLSVDPMVFGTSQLYEYAEDNPVNDTDPMGLCNAQGNGSAWDLFNPWRSNNSIRCSVQKHPSSVTSRILESNPAYLAVNGYYNEWQASENGCSLATVAKYGAEGVAGVGLTGLIAVYGAASTTGQSSGDLAYQSNLLGKNSFLFGNDSLGDTTSGLFNQRGSSLQLGWSVDGTMDTTVPGFRLSTTSIDHWWLFHASGF